MWVRACVCVCVCVCVRVRAVRMASARLLQVNVLKGLDPKPYPIDQLEVRIRQLIQFFKALHKQAIAAAAGRQEGVVGDGSVPGPAAVVAAGNSAAVTLPAALDAPIEVSHSFGSIEYHHRICPVRRVWRSCQDAHRLPFPVRPR